MAQVYPQAFAEGSPNLGSKLYASVCLQGYRSIRKHSNAVAVSIAMDNGFGDEID